MTERERGNRESVQPRVLIDQVLGRLIGRAESHRGKIFLELKKKANFWSSKKKEVQGDANNSSETGSDIGFWKQERKNLRTRMKIAKQR